jgi:2-haloacid dehalogenase
MKRPKAVIFDIGNVVVEWRPERLYARLIPDPDERTRFFERTEMFKVNLDIDRGEPMRETIYAHADKHPADRDLIRAWADNWREMFAPEITGTLQLIAALRRRNVPVHALSNFGAESFVWGREMYPILKTFDIAVISGHEGTVKPEAEIYEIIEERTGLLGQDLFFTDDSPKNVSAARARFWQAEIFTAPAVLGRQLLDRGLIEPGDLPDLK